MCSAGKHAGCSQLLMQAQVYVFCCAHAEQVKQHLQDAEWTKEGASMDVQVNASCSLKLQVTTQRWGTWGDTVGDIAGCQSCGALEALSTQDR